MNDKSSLSKYFLVYSNEDNSGDWAELKFYGLFSSFDKAEFFIEEQYRPQYDAYLTSHQRQVDRAEALAKLTKEQKEALGLYYNYSAPDLQTFDRWVRTLGHYKIEIFEVIDGA